MELKERMLAEHTGCRCKRASRTHVMERGRKDVAERTQNPAELRGSASPAVAQAQTSEDGHHKDEQLTQTLQELNPSVQTSP